MPEHNLIIADDDSTVCRLLEVKAKHFGFHPVIAYNGSEALKLVNEHIDVILLDVQMPEMDGIECLKKLSQSHSHIPVIMLSSENEASVAMQCVKLGALDYLTKPFDIDELFTSLRNARRISRIEKENTQLRENLSDAIGSPAANLEIINSSPKTIALQKQATKVAKLNSTVLLTGESGTGKSLLARSIHAQSDRCDKPFITVSCPALPRELLESELFGHEKGAFTGAIQKRTGKIEAATGGTLFLDEIGELPLDLQPKLLNFLQDKEFSRVGGTKVIHSDTRIITATNINFKEKIANKEFREDLFYRISVIPLELPALRDQLENILPLTMHFLDRISNRRKIPRYTLSDDARKQLLDYHWPGNIRQLENLIERAAAFCEDYHIDLEDLSLEATHPEENIQTTSLAGLTLAEVEAMAIRQTLSYCKNNKAETARTLGITEKSIYNKIKRHHL